MPTAFHKTIIFFTLIPLHFSDYCFSPQNLSQTKGKARSGNPENGIFTAVQQAEARVYSFNLNTQFTYVIVPINWD